MKTKAVSSQLIDERVILTMIVCSLLALVVLAFRYKTTEPYPPVNISAKDGYTNEVIRFIAEGKDIKTKDLVWDFADSIYRYGKGPMAFHQFSTPGRYEVKLTVNGTHYKYKTIYIKKAIPVDNPTILIAHFTGPDKAIAGEPVTFKDSTQNASKWVWYFGENTTIDASTPKAMYTFRAEGWKKIILIVNDSIQGERRIYIGAKPNAPKNPDPPPPRPLPIPDSPVGHPIQPKPDTTKVVAPPSPTPKHAPPISENEIEAMLRQFVDDKKRVSDFSVFVCDNLLITVKVNGKTGMPLKTFCEEFKKDVEKSAHIRSLEVSFEKDENTNCIKSLSVKYRKYKWVGQILH